MPSLHRSLRHAARRLLSVPGFTAAATLTLALGIGATTLVFSVVNAVLLRPLPYADSDRLVSLSHTLVVGEPMRVEQSDASLLFYPRHARAFAGIGGYGVAAAGLSAPGGEPERVAAGRVTAGLFVTLGVSPLRGRVINDADDQPGAAPVAVIAESLWARKYGRDPGVLDFRIEVDGVPHDIIGVMPAGFRFPEADTAVWLPLRLDPARTDSATFDYHAIARLHDGVTNDAATSELDALLPRLPDEFPGRLTRAAIDQTRMRTSVRPLADVVIGDVGRVLWVVLAAAVFVLAIACANVANLFLVRGEARRQAYAVQRALGASRGAILAETLAEGLLVAAPGGVLGLAIAVAGVRLLRASGHAIDIPRLAEVSVDPTVALVAVSLIAFATLFVSGLPSLRAGAASSTSLLGATTRGATASRERHRARHALVVSQVALAMVLIAGAGLMARTVWRLGLVQPGFDAERAMAFRIALPRTAYPTPDEAARFYQRAVDTIAALPGVQAAAAISKLPLDELGRVETAVFFEDRPLAPGSLPAIHPVAYATPDYFNAAGIPLLAGRSLARPDPPRTPLEVVVSRAFAERYWGTASAIGNRLRIVLNGPLYTVVGVSGDVRDTALDRPEDQLIYASILPPAADARWAPRDLALVARTASDPAAVTAAVRDAVRGLDPSLPIYRERLLTDVVAQASSRRALVFLLIGCASSVALLLGAVGLYGVMSYVVSLRTREIGLRIALGARPGQVRWMVARQGVEVAAAGIVTGLAGAVLVTPWLATLLFEVRPGDPVVLAAAAVLMLVVAGAATWLPARRAAAIDPARAISAE